MANGVPDHIPPELAPFFETKKETLDQIRKDLSEEYARFMGKMLRERIRMGGGGSVFNHMKNDDAAADGKTAMS